MWLKVDCQPTSQTAVSKTALQTTSMPPIGPFYSLELTSELYDAHINEHTGALGERGYHRLCAQLPNSGMPTYKAALRKFGVKHGLTMGQLDRLLEIALPAAPS
jgi:hypothetical protein